MPSGFLQQMLSAVLKQVGTAGFAQLFEKLMAPKGCLSLRLQNNWDAVPTVPEGMGLYHHVLGGLWMQPGKDGKTQVLLHLLAAPACCTSLFIARAQQ